MAGPVILYYNLDRGAEAALQALCRRQGLGCRAVAPAEYCLPVGALAGIPVSGAAVGAPAMGFSDPMLVMCGLLAPQLDAFLQGLRDGGMPRIALKAVLTPANVAWSSARLRDELIREHDAVRKARSAPDV